MNGIVMTETMTVLREASRTMMTRVVHLTMTNTAVIVEEADREATATVEKENTGSTAITIVVTISTITK